MVKKFLYGTFDIQGKPKNRKLPYPASVYCFTYEHARVGQFPISGFSLYHILNKYKKIPHEVLRPRNYEVNPTGSDLRLCDSPPF